MAFIESLNQINSKKSKKERKFNNLWDAMLVEPMEPYFEYFTTPRNISFCKRGKLYNIWKNYIVTETGRTSHFSLMERMKLVNQIIISSMNINFLIEKGNINKIFALNDNYELFG